MGSAVLAEVITSLPKCKFETGLMLYRPLPKSKNLGRHEVRLPSAPSDLPKSGGTRAPPPPFGTCLLYKGIYLAVFSWLIFIRAVIDHITCLNWSKIKL